MTEDENQLRLQEGNFQWPDQQVWSKGGPDGHVGSGSVRMMIKMISPDVINIKVAGSYLQLQQGYGANSRGIHKIWQVCLIQLKTKKKGFKNLSGFAGLGVGHSVISEPLLWGAATTGIESCRLLWRQEKKTQSWFLTWNNVHKFIVLVITVKDILPESPLSLPFCECLLVET